MQLPQSIIDEAERHACLTGCYSDRAEVRVCLGVNRPAERVLVADCEDCLSFYLGVPRSLLPRSTTRDEFAQALSEHLRQVRGFDLAFAGYHASGPGFWLSGVYYAHLGVFLLDGHRSRPLGSDLDLLVKAFQHGVIPLPDPQMLDLAQYAVRDVYLSRSQPLIPVASLGDLLALPQIQLQSPSAPGWRRITLAEFQPIAARLQSSPSGKSQPGKSRRPSSKRRRPARIGDVCSVCQAEIRERPLLNGTYIGCLC